ncbi:MAG: hypothetical protein FVQ79_02180 [Planctomycetes bacterium]|nr:hypothetical protein [Planctomycetota bacterium]
MADDKELWLTPRRIRVVEGYSGTRTILYDGVGALTNEAVVMFSGAEDVSTDKLSGAPTTSGNILTTPTVQNLLADTLYVMVVTVTEDGNPTRPRKQEWYCEAKETLYNE